MATADVRGRWTTTVWEIGYGTLAPLAMGRRKAPMGRLFEAIGYGLWDIGYWLWVIGRCAIGRLRLLDALRAMGYRRGARGNLSPSPAGRNLINLISHAKSIFSMYSVIYCHRSSYRLERYSCAESYECSGMHIRD